MHIPPRDNNQYERAGPLTNKRGCTSLGHLRRWTIICDLPIRFQTRQAHQQTNDSVSLNHAKYRAPAGGDLEAPAKTLTSAVINRSGSHQVVKYKKSHSHDNCTNLASVTMRGGQLPTEFHRSGMGVVRYCECGYRYAPFLRVQ